MSEHEEFRRMVKAFAEGEVEKILMHIDTTRLLSPDDWDLLKTAGATVVTVDKSPPGNN